MCAVKASRTETKRRVGTRRRDGGTRTLCISHLAHQGLSLSILASPYLFRSHHYQPALHASALSSPPSPPPPLFTNLAFPPPLLPNILFPLPQVPRLPSALLPLLELKFNFFSPPYISKQSLLLPPLPTHYVFIYLTLRLTFLIIVT